MTQETQALTLPDEATFRRDIQAINRFQQVVHSTMVSGLDYGIIPGTQKPTLLKPGAEKIAKLLGLADQYQIMDKAEDWQKPFFRYLIKCQLIHVGTSAIISEGLGECNSMEAKYRWRWVGERDLPGGSDKLKLVKQERKSRAGGHWIVYRLENDDVFSEVNTILKMAKKRALVDAALSAGRLSDVFTQDIEDMGIHLEEKEHEPEPPQDVPPAKSSPSKEETGSEVPATGKTSPNKEALLVLDFNNEGDFRTACWKYFNLPKSKQDKEVPEFDLSNPGQRKKAWIQIVGTYSRKEATTE